MQKYKAAQVFFEKLRTLFQETYHFPIMQPQPGIFLCEIVDLIKKDPRFLVYDYRPGDQLCYVMNRKEKVEYILAMETSCFKFTARDVAEIEKEKRIPRY